MTTKGSAPLRIFVQARMSSRRFPGKVLTPLAGRPMIAHVLERCGEAFGADKVVLATSVDPSDDPLAEYAERHGHTLFRGDLDNVVARFQQCLAAYPCDWFVRISGDSPLIDPALIARIAERRGPQYDLVTNVQSRTFPSGQSVEVVLGQCFAGIDAAVLSADAREHVTLFFYHQPGKYRIRSVISRDSRLAGQSLAVDTVDDLRRIETLIAAGSVSNFAAAIDTSA
jgi:spore coat polysaccharide biosynthesis protein SpsF